MVSTNLPPISSEHDPFPITPYTGLYPNEMLERHSVRGQDGRTETMTASSITLEALRAPITNLFAPGANVLVVADAGGGHAGYEPLLDVSDISVTTATSRVDALHQLRSDATFDLVLIDASTEHQPLHELCRKMKQDTDLQLLPIMILFRSDQRELRRKVLRSGADACLTIPEESEELLHRCTNLIRTKQATDVLENSEKVIFALACLIEAKDKYTHGHVERVSAYSVQLGQRLGVSDADLVALNKGGIVHDIGKIAVPDAILNKPGSLNPAEREVMQRHPVVGYDLLAPMRTFKSMLPIVRWHHERPNGTGYPDGIGGDELPLVARITGVADCFDALTTSRPYRPGFPLDRAIAILTSGATEGQFDPEVVALMCELSHVE